MNLYTSASTAALVINVALGFFVIHKGRDLLRNRLFGILCIIIGIWCAYPLAMSLAPSPEAALLFVRFIYVFAVFCPTVYLHFVLVLVNARKHLKPFVYAAYSTSAVLFFLNFSPLFIKDVTRNVPQSALQKFTLVPGPVYLVYVLGFVVMVGYGYTELIRAYRKSTAFERNQLRYIFLAFIVSALGGLIHFSSSFGYKEPFPHDFLLIAFTSVTSYAIVKHRLMDIRIIVKTGVIYALSTGVITGSFMLLVLGFQTVFSEYAVHARLPVAAVAALVIALAFYPVKDRIQRAVDKYFYKEAYDYHRVLGDASKAMTSILDFEKLLSYILRAINDSMKIERGWILLRSQGGRKFDVRITAAFEDEPEFPAEAPLTSRNVLMEYLRGSTEPIVREEIERMLLPDEAGSISREMGRFNADVAVPIVLKNRLMGAILLGPKLSGDIYTDEDLQLLTTLANQAAVAIRNAQLYSRLQQDLDTIRYLEREKAKAERLASLGTMAAGIAHEIKNPLVSIKTFAQLLPEKASDPEFRDDFSQIATKEIDRIDSLVQGLLSLAKPSPPVFEAVDVNSVLDEILTSVLIRMENRKISLRKEYDHDLPPAMGDVHQLKQVFSNIIINAIQATPEGGKITVMTSSCDRSRGRDGCVSVKISDTGSGISQEESERIFNPFFTTKHEGVGLGLTICHRIIEDHRGAIEMESRVGKGTTFTISVPVADREGSIASRANSS